MKKRLMLLVILIVGAGWLGYDFSQRPQPEKIVPANVGARSFSVGWYTGKLTKACVAAMPKGSWKPWEWVVSCESGFDKAIHLVDVEGVKPATSYRVAVIDGLRLTFKGILPVRTKQSDEQLPLTPNPAYGSVIGSGGTLGAGALVYIYPKTDQFNYPVATVANGRGNYAVDLADLTQQSDRLKISAVGGSGIWNEIEASSQLIQPLPTMTVYLE